MTLTIDSDWLREFRRADVAPVAWVQVEWRSVTATITTANGDATLATPTANLFAGMTVTGSGVPAGTTISSITDGSNLEMTANATASASVSITFKKVFNLISAPAPNITDGQICVDELAPITRKLDPYTRQIETDETNILFNDDGVIRHINGSYPLKGKKVIVRIGTAALGETEFQTYFTGFIDELVPVEGALEAQCVEFTSMLDDYPFRGQFVCKHPLVVLKQLLLACGIPSDMIDDNSFDPSQGAYDTIRQYTLTSIMVERDFFQIVINPMGGAPWLADSDYRRLQGTGATPDGYPHAEAAMNARDLVNKIVMFLSGMLYSESGTIKFSLFDKTAAVARHLTVHDYRNFIQVESQKTIINDLRIDLGDGGEGKFLTATDAASIAEYGAYTHVETPTFMTAKMILKWLVPMNSPFNDDIESGEDLSETFVLTSAQVTGLAGTQGTGNGGSGALAFGSGAAGGYTTSAKYGVIEYNGELIKVTQIAMQSTPVSFVPIVSDDGVTSVETYQNGDLILTEKHVNDVHVTGGVRGFAGTTPNIMTDVFFATELVIFGRSAANDVTIPYQWATNYVMPRFANGLAMCEIETSYEHYDLEVGDLISIDNDQFLWRNVNGLSSTSKLEIIGKEIEVLTDTPKIKFTLAMANPASTPSQTVTYATTGTPVNTGGKGKGGFDGLSMMASTSGSAMAHGGASARKDSTNYDVVVDACRPAVGNLMREYSENIALKDLDASKDHYIAVDPTNGLFVAHTVTSGAAEPMIHGSNVRVCKVVAGASNITSVVDQRDLQPITGAMIDRSSLQLEQLVPAPNFSRWVLGPYGDPYGWTATSGTWGTDLTQGTAQKRSGRYSLKLIDSGNDAAVISDEFTVTPGEVYHLNFWARANDNSTAFQGKLTWYDETRTAISTHTLFNDSADAANTWEQKHGYQAAPSTASTCKVTLTRNTAGPEVYFDRVELRRGHPTFSAYLSGDQTPTSQDRINFNTVDHDHGGWYSTGGARAAAPTSGVYSFSWNLKIEPSSNSKAVTILIRKNASAYNNGTEIKTFNLGDIATGDSGHEMFTFTIDALKLEAADYISAYITFSSGQPVIAGGAAESSFSGRRIN